MSIKDEHQMDSTTKTKKVKAKLPRSKGVKAPFVPNAQKSASRIKASLASKSNAKTQVGFD